jgi:hypothetical protein
LSFIRKNTDITQIVIHHTQDPSVSAGINLNKEYVQSGAFGSPFDIHINGNGSIDLTPQWFYAVQSSQYLQNVSLFSISQYPLHYPAAIGETFALQFNAIHIAVIGDFNKYFPTSQQINSLIVVLTKLSKAYLIDLNENLIYHNEVLTTPCPGVNFISKQNLIKASVVTLVPNFVIQNDFITKVTNPLVLNFIGDNVTVTNVNNIVNISYY